MSTRCNSPKGLDLHEAPVSGPPGSDLVERADDRGVAAAIGRTTRQQEAPSSEVQGERKGESSDRRADHPNVSVANEDSALVRGCLVAVDARDQVGPCSPGCSSAIVINKISIRAVSIPTPFVICGIPVMAVIVLEQKSPSSVMISTPRFPKIQDLHYSSLTSSWWWLISSLVFMVWVSLM